MRFLLRGTGRRLVLLALAMAACLATVPGLQAQSPVGPPFYPLTDDNFIRFPLPPSAQQYGSIDGRTLKADLNALVAISKKSHDDGNQFWGRITGTPYDAMARQWLTERFKKIGLQTREEPLPLPPLWFPKHWTFNVVTPQKSVPLRTAQPVHESASSPPGGVELEAVYVGLGTPADFKGRDVKGKAVFIFAIPEPGMLVTSARRNNAVKRAQDNGATAVILVLGMPGNFTNQMWPQGATIPTFSMGQEDGETVRKLIEEAPPGQAPKIRFDLTTEMVAGLTTASIWGVLPGMTSENVLVMAHYDGFFEAAMDNASGVATMLGLAEYFAKIPKEKRRRTITFIGFATHHEEPGELWRKWMLSNQRPFLTNTAFIVNCEHTALVEFYTYAGTTRRTNGVAARRVSISGSQAFTDILMSDLKLFGVTTYFERDVRPLGEIRSLFELAPGFQTIRDGVFYHSDQDTPDTVPAVGLEALTRAYAKVIDDTNKLEMSAIRSPTGNHVP
jgi:hypothetical protein